MATVAEYADAVATELDETGWCGDGPKGKYGELCLMLAADQAARKMMRAGRIEGQAYTCVWPRVVQEFFSQVSAAIAANFPDRPNVIHLFNDDPRTTREDINLVVKLGGAG